MKFEELTNVSTTARKPLGIRTDKEWQNYFSILKLIIRQGKDKKMRLPVAKTIVAGEYKGDTNYKNYCCFINDVLKAIRKEDDCAPHKDYCFFIYQIADLLKYEHDRLHTRWCPDEDYFEVWLED